MGLSAIQGSRFDEAALQFGRGSHASPGNTSQYFLHAMAQALAGRAPEGPPVRRERELEPGWRFGLFFQIGVARSIADKLAEGARLLGLPE